MVFVVFVSFLRVAFKKKKKKNSLLFSLFFASSFSLVENHVGFFFISSKYIHTHIKSSQSAL